MLLLRAIRRVFYSILRVPKAIGLLLVQLIWFFVGVVAARARGALRVRPSPLADGGSAAPLLGELVDPA